MKDGSHYLTNAVTPNKDEPNREFLKEGEKKLRFLETYDLQRQR